MLNLTKRIKGEHLVRYISKPIAIGPRDLVGATTSFPIAQQVRNLVKYVINDEMKSPFMIRLIL